MPLKINNIQELKSVAKYSTYQRNSDLVGADLSDSNLNNAELEGADFEGADIEGARFEGAIYKNEGDKK